MFKKLMVIGLGVCFAFTVAAETFDGTDANAPDWLLKWKEGRSVVKQLKRGDSEFVVSLSIDLDRNSPGMQSQIVGAPAEIHGEVLVTSLNGPMTKAISDVAIMLELPAGCVVSDEDMNAEINYEGENPPFRGGFTTGMFNSANDPTWIGHAQIGIKDTLKEDATKSAFLFDIKFTNPPAKIPITYRLGSPTDGIGLGALGIMEIGDPRIDRQTALIETGAPDPTPTPVFKPDFVVTSDKVKMYLKPKDPIDPAIKMKSFVVDVKGAEVYTFNAIEEAVPSGSHQGETAYVVKLGEQYALPANSVVVSQLWGIADNGEAGPMTSVSMVYEPPATPTPVPPTPNPTETPVPPTPVPPPGFDVLLVVPLEQ